MKDLLSRNCIDTEEYTQEERFVVSQLGLPPCLLHEAKALCAHYEGDSKREAGHLLRANMWDAAHSVITNKLVSLAVINRKALVVCCVYMCVCVRVGACVLAYLLVHVRACVCVFVREEYTQEERFVVSQLGLPPCLLHEAKASCAHYEHCVVLCSVKSQYCNCFTH